MKNDTARAGPVCCLATVPTRIYTPAPIVVPTPSKIPTKVVNDQFNLQKKND